MATFTLSGITAISSVTVSSSTATVADAVVTVTDFDVKHTFENFTEVLPYPEYSGGTTPSTPTTGQLWPLGRY